ncbi:MAG: ABC transporter permease [Defluviitaleaceae bacterium]|nr:ABC transporter permease [Defluviitaleaceae bacterium]
MSSVTLILDRHMNFLKRATTSVLRRPGKTIILLLLVFILGSVIAGAISVEGAISNTDANLRRNMQPIMSIGMDHEAWWEYESTYDFDWETTFPPAPPILTPADVRAIGDLNYVTFYDYMAMVGLSSLDLRRYEGEHESWFQEGVPDWFDLRGVSSSSMVVIEEGIIELVQGRQFESGELTPGNERATALISVAFADVNELAIGSTFELYEVITLPTDPDGDSWIEWGPEMFIDENVHARVGLEFEVVGLFDVPLDPDVVQHSQEYQDRIRALNAIYAPNWSIEDVTRRIAVEHAAAWEASPYDAPGWVGHQLENSEHQMRVIPLFVLEDPADMDHFRTAGAHYLPDFYQFEDLSSAFDEIASSMATMQTIANWILYVSIGATLLILSLLITLFLRDRRYEMGVYLALGEKKGKIITQILMEVLVTSFVAITLSVFVGSLISGRVSHNMLMNELTAEVNNDPWDNWRHEWTIFDEIGIPTTSMSADEMMAQFDVSLGIQTIGLFYVIGLGAVILSTLAPVIYVVTLNPKKVLM